MKNAESLISVSVKDSSGKTVSSGTGFIVHHSGIIAISCPLAMKWIEKVDNTLSMTNAGNRVFEVENLLSSRCERRVVYLKIRGSAIPAPALAAIAEREKKARAYLLFRIDGKKTQTAEITGSLASFHAPKGYVPGNSTAPVVDNDGNAIGIAVAPSEKSRTLTVVPVREVEKTVLRYARAFFRPSVKTVPPDPEQPLKPGQAPEFQEFEKAMQEAAASPDKTSAYSLIGKSYASRGMYHEASIAFRESVNHDPFFFEGYLNLGVACYKTMRYQQALDAFNLALSLRPGSPDIHKKIGTVHLLSGDYRKAVQSFQKALSHDPENADLHFNLGLAYFLMGDKKAAVGHYITLQRLDGRKAAELEDLLY